MYTVTESFLSAVTAAQRMVRAKAVITRIDGSEQPLSDENALKSISITRPLTANDALIGSAVSGKIECVVLDPDGSLSSISDGEKLSVWLGVESTGGPEWVYFPEISLDTVSPDPDSHTVTLSGFDDMSRLERKTFSDLSLSYPITLRGIAEAAVQAVGLSLSEEDFLLQDQSYGEDDVPNLAGDETLREIIAWVAEAALSNAVIGRDGKVHFVPMIPAQTADCTVDAENYFTFLPDSAWGPINTLVLGRVPQEDNIYREDASAVAQNGTKELRINDNPFLDGRRDLVIDTLFSAANGLTIVPYTLDWRGNPAVDPGDTIQITDSKNGTALVMCGGTSMDFDGGLRFSTELSIKSFTETDKTKAESLRSSTRRTFLQVNKASQEIQALVSETDDLGLKTANLSISLDGLMTQVQRYEESTDADLSGMKTLISELQQTASELTLSFQTLQDSKADASALETLTGAVKVGAENGIPYIELVTYTQETDEQGNPVQVQGDYSLKITNGKVSFLQSASEVAYVSNAKLYITRAEITGDLTIGGNQNASTPYSGQYIWRQHGELGNLGLRYIERTEEE